MLSIIPQMTDAIVISNIIKWENVFIVGSLFLYKIVKLYLIT